MKPLYYLFSLPILVMGPISPAAEVLDWRNGGNGQYPGVKPAQNWEGDSVWKTPLEKHSNASPILVDGKLFVTAEPATLVCLDAKTGKVLWEKANDLTDLVERTPAEVKKAEAEAEEAAATLEAIEPLERSLYRAERRMRRNRDDEDLKAEVDGLKKQIAELKKGLPESVAAMEKPPAHDTNGYASYTPVSDGKRIWASFGMGVVVCYDLEGKRLWHQRFEGPDHKWGGACSPKLVGDRLVVRFTDYHGLDPATGKELWKVPSEGIVFNGPAPITLEGKSYVVTPRGEVLRVSDGRKVWSAGFEVQGKEWAFFNTPSVIGRRVFFAQGAEGMDGDAYCLEIPESVAELESKGMKEIWSREVVKNRYYSSPLVVDGIVYLIARDYDFQALDAETGEPLYEQKMKGMTGTAYPSLTLAGEVIIVGADDGKVAFVKPGRKFEEIGRTEVASFRSSPVFADGLGYVRTMEGVLAVKGE